MPCNLTFALAILSILLLYCVALSLACLVVGFQNLGDCNPFLSVHLILQGFGLFSICAWILWVGCKHYYKPKPSDLNSEGTVLQQFWRLFRSDLILTTLTLLTLTALIWALVGFSWLSHDDDDDKTITSLDSLANTSVILVVGISASFTLIVVTLMSCDEGSCTPTDLGLSCFLCLCFCCIKETKGLHHSLSEQFQRSRSMYPQHRHFCLSKVLKAVYSLGFVIENYTGNRYSRNLDSSVAQELAHSVVVPDVNVPAGKTEGGTTFKTPTASNSPPGLNSAQ